jgi:hypothetical protein
MKTAIHRISPRNTFAALLLSLTTRQARGLLSLAFLDTRIAHSNRSPGERLNGIRCVHNDGSLIASMI